MANLESRVKALEKTLIPLDERKFECRISFIRPGDMAVVGVTDWIDGKWVHTTYIPEENVLP